MLPPVFKIKMGRVFPSDDIVYCECKDNVVTTRFNNGFIDIIKTCSVRDAIESIAQGFWIIVD